MLTYLTPEWLAAADAAIAEAFADDSIPLVVGYHVSDSPNGSIDYYVELGGTTAGARQGCHGHPTVTFALDYRTACEIAEGELSAADAVISGRAEVSGDVLALVGRGQAPLDDVLASLRKQTRF